MVDYVNHWSKRADVPKRRLFVWLDLRAGKYHEWKKRYGKVNEHNGLVPRDHWLEAHEQQAILDFERQYPLEGYRRLTFMMLDRDIVAASPSSVYRVLKRAGRLNTSKAVPSKKGTGFQQPLQAHEHWHVDISYLNIAGTFYYLCSVLDGYSRYIVHWEIREQMKEIDVETIVQRAREKHPDVRPRIISDNGPQFVAREFKAFVRLSGMTHVHTSPYYPQSNGKMERWYGSLKRECVRPGTPLCVEDARRLVAAYVQHYNGVRLHGAIGYITPADKLAGRADAIHHERDRKLQAARARRCQRRATCHTREAPAACVTEQQRRASRGPGGGNEPPGRPNQERVVPVNVPEGETNNVNHSPRSVCYPVSPKPGYSDSR